MNEAQRKQAVNISRALELSRKSNDAEEAELLMKEHLLKCGIRIDYAVIRSEKDLVCRPKNGERGRALVAGVIGDTRLIDNKPWPKELI